MCDAPVALEAEAWTEVWMFVWRKGNNGCNGSVHIKRAGGIQMREAGLEGPKGVIGYALLDRERKDGSEGERTRRIPYPSRALW